MTKSGRVEGKNAKRNDVRRAEVVEARPSPVGATEGVGGARAAILVPDSFEIFLKQRLHLRVLYNFS